MLLFCKFGQMEIDYGIINRLSPSSGRAKNRNMKIKLSDYSTFNKEWDKGHIIEETEKMLERIELKEKHWKHNDGDWDTREKFDEDMDLKWPELIREKFKTATI